MSNLRRLAQTNNAAAQANSPSPAAPSTPVKGPSTPVTPRTRISYPISPFISPSLSASTPFDWEAARSRKPPPYATPVAGKRARALRNASPTKGTSGKRERVVRKKGFLERITSMPSQIMFHIALFPNNLPLPTPQKSALIIGSIMHILHFSIRVTQIRKIPDSDLGWEDLYREDEGSAWFDWTLLTSCLLIAVSVVNGFYLFTRTRMYQLTLATDPVGSPHAKFVRRESTPQEEGHKAPSRFGLIWSIVKQLWHGFMVSLRFLLNMTPPKDRQTAAGRFERVQQLEVWTPGEFEMSLFSIYPPVHALLWMALTSANWIIVTFIMGVTSMHIRALILSFQALQKDRAIISAEVMHEYDEKFVIPRINPIRKDAAVMTHQAEMVNHRCTIDDWHRMGTP